MPEETKEAKEEVKIELKQLEKSPPHVARKVLQAKEKIEALLEEK